MLSIKMRDASLKMTKTRLLVDSSTYVRIYYRLPGKRLFIKIFTVFSLKVKEATLRGSSPIMTVFTKRFPVAGVCIMAILILFDDCVEMFKYLNGLLKKDKLIIPRSRGIDSDIYLEEDSYVWFLENKDNLTPLQLSAKLVVVEIFQFIIKLENVYSYFTKECKTVSP
jgi:hypothetical protein